MSPPNTSASAWYAPAAPRNFRNVGSEPPVPVQPRVKQGRPAKVLIDESENADLLVVGSRGHGGFKGLVLGSVSQHAAAYAKCPVTVVR